MIRLPSFNIGQRIINAERGTATTEFLSYINNSIRVLADAIDRLGSAVETIDNTVTQVAVAVETANQAFDAAGVGSAEASLVNSYVEGSQILSTTIPDPINFPDDAIITIAAHKRVYADGTKVNVPGSTIGAGSTATTTYVTYRDPERDGKDIAYALTNDPLLAGQGNDRHLVGVIGTPPSGSSGVYYGRTTLPPGLRGLT